MSKDTDPSRIGYIKRHQRERAANSPGTDSAASRITLVVTPHPALLSMLKINASITTRAPGSCWGASPRLTASRGC